MAQLIIVEEISGDVFKNMNRKIKNEVDFFIFFCFILRSVKVPVDLIKEKYYFVYLFFSFINLLFRTVQLVGLLIIN